jgi:uncharacterized protein YecT (DUF1311 family)
MKPTNLKGFYSPFSALVGVLAIGFISPLIASTALAQKPNCITPQTQAEMNACAGLSFQTSDRELNRVYQALLPSLSGPRRQKLVNAQLRWIQFRDHECTFYGSLAEGGSMQPMLITGCKDQLTQQRTTDLNAYLNGTTLSVNSNQQTADRRLNQHYQLLQKTLPPQRKRQLETAELSWIGFRDSTCEFETDRGGNTARDRCLVRLTEQRNQQLVKYLETNKALSSSGLFTQNRQSQSSQMGLIPSLKMILKILNWTY